jgi:O-antigen/teichoic acid export membrane protein
MCIVYPVLCMEAMPSLRRGFVIDRSHVAPLLRLGGWMTVSNVVSPLMVSLDRFLIGSMVSVGAITYYTAPYEVVTKLWIIPYSLVRVLFPAFAATSGEDRSRLDSLFDIGVDVISLIMLPIVVVTVILAGDVLTYWLGVEFSRNGARVMQWLVLGVYLNSLAMIPSTLLQALGRPDLTAKLHLIELPVFLLVLWSMIHMYGIEGAAIAWVLRVGFDGLLLFAAARRLLPGGASRHHGSVQLVGVLLPLLIIAALQFAVMPKWAIISLAFLACGVICWRRLLRGGRSLMGGSLGAIWAD